MPGALRYTFWEDEVASARVIDEPTLAAALGRIEHTESTPPAWYLLAWLGHRAGLSMTELRLLSAACSVATAGLVVLFASRILSTWGAGLAGLLVALGWQFVFHGRELRAYTLLALSSVVFALVLERAVRHPTTARLAALSGVVAVGSMTHYFFLFTLAAGGVWAIVAAHTRGVRLRLLAAAAAGLVGLALWAPVLSGQYGAARFAWIGPFDGRDVVESVWLTFARGFPPDPHARPILAAVAFASVLVGAAALARDRGRGLLCALLALGPVALAALAWLAGPRIFLARNLIGAAPFAAVAIAATVERMPRRTRAAAGALLAAACLVGVARTERAAPVAYDRVAAAVAAEGWTPASPLVIAAGWAVRPPLAWYLPGHPRLVDARPLRRRCAAIYVVADRSAWGRIARSGLVVDARAVGSYRIARLAPMTARRALRLAPGGLLVQAEGREASCASRAASR